ncbi:hypothetical protein [Lichenibacterium ramalinae]|uniref:PepSY domain-containing protein n=1 Tax=Lichenibacterium ramalinae TaxID=2316527 RepID=A0A4V1RI79_9HYPH|nr:hypothetical protein [Lichenibacterium ramalinae]RYB02663.1 hypothetical protein D3272_19880 [Lichenibacterium ramalinae]
MRALLPSLIVLTLAAGPALAQNATPASPGSGTMTNSSNGAVNGSGNAGSNVNASGTVNVLAMTALEKGANSFTEGQAKSRISSAGFTDVSDLKKDDQGIWRGTATRGGKQEQIGFDYKGNIGAQ